MKEYEKSVIPIIEANYGNMTMVEKNIANFFISNKEEKDFSAKSIAEELFVSESSLSRFAKKMGYLGYREFIYHYQDTFLKEEVRVQEDTKEVLNTYQELLNKSYSLINEEQLARVVTLISKKKRIYVYGLGSSGLVAQEFKLRFMRLGLDVEAITDFHQLMMNAVRLNKECLVIGISLSGSTKEIIDSLLQAKEKEATTIFITSRLQEKFILWFNEVILTAVKQNLEYGNVISPQFPILVIMDIIYANYLKEDRNDKKAIYDTTVEPIIGRYV
ncbi:MAG: MurR/RpiR family transcriptional regulator [Velocimicrobium sp.]